MMQVELLRGSGDRSDVEGVEIQRQAPGQPPFNASSEDENNKLARDLTWYIESVLQLGGIFSRHKYPKLGAATLLWGAFIGLYAVFIAIVNFAFRDPTWLRIGVTVWLIHSTLVFYNLTRSVMAPLESDVSIFKCIQSLTRPMTCELLRTPTTSYLTVARVVCWTIVAAIAINFAIGFFVWQEIIPDLTGNTAYVVLYLLVSFFWSTGWFIYLPFIIIPCYILTSKIKSLIIHIETTHDLAICDVTRWFNELYSLNASVNSCLGLTVTVSTIIMGFLDVFMILSTFAENNLDVAFIAAWVLVNIFITAVLCKSLCDVEDQSKSLLLAFAALEAKSGAASHYEFQTVLSKMQVLKFGVKLFGTKLIVSYNIVVKLAGIIGSIFLFLFGLSLGNNER
jgi:hypothetical protein